VAGARCLGPESACQSTWVAWGFPTCVVLELLSGFVGFAVLNEDNFYIKIIDFDEIYIFLFCFFPFEVIKSNSNNLLKVLDNLGFLPKP
jgi:hypothetical protein